MNYEKLCRGCGHRIAMHIIDDIIEKRNLKEKVILALDVACCSLIIDDCEYDSIMSPHGRVLPVSKGIKSIKKDRIIVSYMGDGAAYNIGMGEMVNAAMRNDDALIIVINNGFLSMTGGQASNTALNGAITASTPYGKDKTKDGEALKFENILAGFNVSYFARAALNSKKNIDDAYLYINKAFDKYISCGGFNMVELVSPCPSNFRLSPKDMFKYIDDVVLKYYKTGEFIC